MWDNGWNDYVPAIVLGLMVIVLYGHRVISWDLEGTAYKIKTIIVGFLASLYVRFQFQLDLIGFPEIYRNIISAVFTIVAVAVWYLQYKEMTAGEDTLLERWAKAIRKKK